MVRGNSFRLYELQESLRLLKRIVISKEINRNVFDYEDENETSF